MQTVPVIDQGVFKTLNAGYYCLAVGTVLTAVMTFLCGLKVKQKVVEADSKEQKQTSMLDQIDRLYDNENAASNDMAINQVDIIQPLQPTNNLNNNIIEPINPISIENSISEETVIQNDLVIEQANNITEPIQQEIQQSLQPEINMGVQETESITIQNSNEMVPPTVVQPTVEQNVSLQDLKSVQEEQPVQTTNPVVAEFENPVSQNVNPVVSEFAPQNNSAGVNPVVAEFSVPSEPTMLSTPVVPEQPITPSVEEEIKPLSSDSMSTLLKEQDNNKSNLDIFG